MVGLPYLVVLCYVILGLPGFLLICYFGGGGVGAARFSFLCCLLILHGFGVVLRWCGFELVVLLDFGFWWCLISSAGASWLVGLYDTDSCRVVDLHVAGLGAFVVVSRVLLCFDLAR